MTAPQMESVSAIAEISARIYGMGVAVGRGDAHESRADLLAVRVELWIEALAQAKLAREIDSHAEIPPEALRCWRRGTLCLLAAMVERPYLFAEAFELDPLDGLVDARAVVDQLVAETKEGVC